MFKYLLKILRPFIDYYVVLASIFCPLCILISNDQESTKISLDDKITIVSSMKSIYFKYILIVVISLSSILFLEVVVDNIFNLKNIFTAKGSLMNLSILLVLLLSSIVSFFIALPSEDSHLMYRVNQVRNIIVFATILSFSSRYGKSFWRKRILFLAYLIGCTGCVLKVVSYSDSARQSNAPFLILSTVGIVSQAFLSGIVIFYTIRWYIYLRKESITRDITTDEWNITLYMTIGSLSLIVLWSFNAFFEENDYTDFSVAHLISIEVTFASFAVIQALHQTHSIRVESNKRKEELEFKRMFVNYISHEIRTPLNTAVMGLQLLSEELQLISPESVDTLKDIKTSCDIAVTTLNELLTFDKLEAGTLMVEKTQFNAFHLLERTVGPFQIQARKSALTLSLRPVQQINSTVNTAVVSADKHKISQIIRNMVSNGLKFTPPGGTVDVLVDVVDGTSADGRACKMLKVDVVDSGAGISPENQKRLFNEIVQFNPGKLQKGGGSGLGLYISHGIAKLHEGSLSVHSDGEGHGCTFTLTLPILPVDKLEAPEIASKRVVGIYSIHSFHSSNSDSDRISIAALPSSIITNVHRRDSRILSICSIDPDAIRMSKRNTSNTSNNNSKRVHVDTISNSPHHVLATINSCTFESPSPNSSARLTSDKKYKNSFCTDSTVTSPIEVVTAPPRGLHMLVVDDSVMSRKMQCRLLRTRCVSCIEAEDGQEAVDKVKRAMAGRGTDGINPIDLVIMDCNMPVMNGMDAANAMRDVGYKGFIIGVTGNVTTEDINDYIAHGADVVLAKPLDIQKFDIAVESLYKGESTADVCSFYT